MKRRGGVHLAADVEIGCEVVERIFVGGGDEEADGGAVGMAAQVIGDDFGEGSIEGGGELVGDDPVGFPGESEGEAEAVALAVAEFVGGSQQQAGFSEAATGEECDGIVDGERE